VVFQADTSLEAYPASKVPSAMQCHRRPTQSLLNRETVAPVRARPSLRRFANQFE
jgi:hypothetical protein